MNIHMSKRLFLPAAVLGALAVFAAAFFVAPTLRSVVAGPSASPDAPNPGHEWSEVEGHGIDGGDYWLGTTVDQALELRVNNDRALRLEPTTDIPNLIGGYSGNNVTAGAVGATIGGGGQGANANRVTDGFGTVGGGVGNVAGDDAGLPDDQEHATVAGGGYNTAGARNATVGGGYQNTASGEDATVGGGDSNTATEQYATVGGGSGNSASGQFAVIGGGLNNTASGNRTTVGGGGANTASADYADVGGGFSNEAGGYSAIVGGGFENTASDSYATVGGGYANTASNSGATVSGGGTNIASGTDSTIGGGDANLVTDDYGTIGGGGSNQAGDNAGTTSDKPYATVGGGYGNNASGHRATVGGGEGNTASGLDAPTVGGGAGNTASGNYATVPGGYDNAASGDYSFAAGYRAKANRDGCFVWADSTDVDFTCPKNDAFTVRATGGFHNILNNGRWVVFWDDGTNLIATSTGGRLTLAGVWTNASDRDQKENFSPVDGQEVLASLVEMPITTWSHEAEDASIRHMGPVAQDFYAAFGLGESDTSIGTLDADGVALAAIQGLYELSQEQAERIDALEGRVAALEGEAGVSGGSAGPLSSVMPFGPLLLGGLVVGGLVLVQHRRAGGPR